MSAVLVPLITASGTVAAAILTGFGAASLRHKWDVDDEKRRVGREASLRFIQDKRDCYSRFMVKMDELIKLMFLLGQPHAPADDHARLEPLIAAMTSEVMLMRLIAPYGLAELAHACMRAPLTEKRSRSEELEGKFTWAARRDLEGITVDFKELDAVAYHHRSKLDIKPANGSPRPPA